ncbi:MAG: DUF1653 domain-containing protein [Rubrivivax sp.]|nr:DUF1653 domain-containing protein [Rubrivivax sp.]
MHTPADVLPPLPTPATGRYRHHKGGEYELIGVVRHSETLEAMVLYRPFAGNRVGSGDWVRPYAMFFEPVIVDGIERPRFERIG